nr:cytidyltransferase-like domain [uncultured bacterium]
MERDPSMPKLFVWGCFDLLHNGHLEFLEHARQRSSLLVVVLLPDEMVVEAKGRLPIQRAERRQKNLLESGYPDVVVIDCADRGLRELFVYDLDGIFLGLDQPEDRIPKAQSLLKKKLKLYRDWGQRMNSTTSLVEKHGETYLREHFSDADLNTLRRLYSSSSQ